MAHLREGIQQVLDQYLAAKAQPLKDHPLAALISQALPASIAQTLGNPDDLLFDGSAGKGNWARGPWFGVFHKVITNTAQKGYYICYLFREDMQGVYLSLNQGMTEAKQNYKADPKTALRARAADFRARLGSRWQRFPAIEISLAPSHATNPTAFYEAGNIAAIYYASHALPTDQQLSDDLRDMVEMYTSLVTGKLEGDAGSDGEDDMPAAWQSAHEEHIEDATRFRYHKRIERNAALAAQVKKIKGSTCEVCGLSFEERYGPIGAGFIEAHHLRPLATLKGSRVPMDPHRDFAVLCSNCHRMVHRSGCVDDMTRFKREYFRDGD